MSTVKQFVFQEQIAPVNGLFIFAEKWNSSTNNREPTATQNSTNVNQGDWLIPSQAGIDFYKSKFSNWTYSDVSKNIKIIWTQGSPPGQVVADYRIAHPIYNTEASKCKITFYNPQMRIGGLVAISNNTGYTIKYTSSYKIINNLGAFPTTGPIILYDNIPSYLQTPFSSISIPSTIDIIYMSNNLIQQGSSVTGGSRNDINGLEYNLQVEKISGSPGGSSINIGPAIYSSYVIREYEGNLYQIDGVNGDSIQPINTSFSLTVAGGIKIPAICNINSQSTFLENSVIVITDVQKTLQSDFALSATAKVTHYATKTLIQQTELLGTVFNFRFMEPLTVSAEHTSLISGNVIRELFSSLSLTNNVTANFVGNMIYDIAVEYTWDDFGIMGYFITGYTVRGYSVEQSEYTWQELVDPWDSWTYSTWQGNETGWDQWPEDIWNSTKRLSFDFDFAQVGQIIRGAVSQLMSTTALTENAAFRKEGVPGEIRSDFLCDGSPSGLIGGSSTIISDAVLTALGNYIIDNAQNITGAFDATLLANYIVQFLWQAQSDFSLAVTPTFKPGGVTNAQCITMVDALGNAIYGPSKTLQGAFDPEFIARIFFTTDPYQIYKVLQETRQIFVDAESRGIEIPEEIRLNSIPAELRDWLVPQETRNMKLRIPPMTNRFTTPKIRRE